MFDSTGSPMPVYLEFHKDGWVDDLLMLDTPPLSFDFNVGNVVMDDTDSIRQLALNLATTYDSSLATVKLRVSDCNLQPSDAIDVTVDGLTIDPTSGMSGSHIAVNLPVPENRIARVEARLKDPATAAPQDPTTEPFIADANLVLRAGAVTLAPFIVPTP